MVVLIVRALYSEYRLLAVLIFRQEYVAIILKITIIRVHHVVCIIHNAVHIFRSDVTYTGVCLITVTPSQVKIAFCEICCGGNLVGTAVLTRSFHRKDIVSSLEVVDHFAEQLSVFIGVVFYRLLTSGSLHLLVDPRYLAEHCQQFVIEMSAEELHLSNTLTCCLCSEFALTVALERQQRAVAARNSAIQTIPQLVHLTRSGRSNGLPYINSVIACIVRSASTLETVV